jgi:hypothetical protein
VCTGLSWKKILLGRPRGRWANNIKIFSIWDADVWTGLMWLRIVTGLEALVMR